MAGYYDDTNQHTIQIQFTLDEPERLEKQKTNLDKFLEIAKPRQDGIVWMRVIENTLSQYGSYHVCYEKDKVFRVHHTYRRFMTNYMTKDELFAWGIKNIPYGGRNDE